jgi:alkanesulfonate monooxygenase SsuD/methylene tetrahydromethanopterin reductase-like flavin-dependent oxidoreductase (luciferase family)
MRFGLFGGARSAGDGPEGDSIGYQRYIDYVLEAEALGFHSVFVVEHHFTGVGQVSASLNLLSYLAARTSRIRLGTAVVVLPWHNPALLAEQVATLDLLSEGRVDLGVGKGYREAEFAGFNIPPSEASERFEEAMAFLRKAWGGTERFSHRGARWQFDNIVIEPKPVQRPHPPFWLGAGSPASIAKAAAEGYNLLLDQVAPIDVIVERARLFRKECAERGRQLGRHQIAVARGLQLIRSEAERADALAVRARVLKAIGGLARGPGAEKYHQLTAETAAELAAEEAALLGTPEEILARLRKLRDGGIDYVLLVDPTGSREALRTFAREIMPALAG